MKRFRFRLDQVRRWREHHVELEELRLEQLQARLSGIEQEQHEVAEATDRSRRSLLAQQSLSAEEMSSLEGIHDYGVQQMGRLMKLRDDVKKGIEEQRRRVMEARRSFQLLDGLRDKALGAWKAARDQEQEELGAELFLARREGRGTGRGIRRLSGKAESEGG